MAEEGLVLERRGIDRVPPDERAHRRLFDNLTVWLSANTVISSVAVGSLAGPLFKLGSAPALLAILVFNLLGVLPVALFATFGPRFGLRQMTLSRFSFGWNAAKLLALLNVAACLGWSAVNSVVGGQILASATAGALPVWAGILLLAAVTTPVSLFGYQFVHRFERYAWLPMGFIFAYMTALAAPLAVWNSAPFQVGPFLSFGSAVLGFAIGWSSYAADYNVNQPEDTPRSRVFWLTYLGVVGPCMLLEMVGLMVSQAQPLQGKMGGELMAGLLLPHGLLGQIALFVLALSVIANNIPNDYSLGLSLQVLGRWWADVPRHVWTLVGAVVYVALAIPAASHFGETLTDFLLVIGYWLGPWATVTALDYFYRGSSYAVERWNDPAALPERPAAILAFLAGLLGAGLGASQALWQGPLSRAWGADVGFELAIGLSAAVYLLFRKR